MAASNSDSHCVNISCRTCIRWLAPMLSRIIRIDGNSTSPVNTLAAITSTSDDPLRLVVEGVDLNITSAFL